MYFWKFVKWFWNVHLNDTSDKIGFSGLCWAVFLIPTIAISFLIGNPFIIGIFMLASIVIIFLLAVWAGIMYIYEKYLYWQSRVFDEIRGPNGK